MRAAVLRAGMCPVQAVWRAESRTERNIGKMEQLLQPEAVEALLRWYETHRRDLPWRHTKDPYRIWISEIMLQQTRVEAVKPYYTRFLEAFPDVAALAEAPEQKLMKLWYGIGYYSRARDLQMAV